MSRHSSGCGGCLGIILLGMLLTFGAFLFFGPLFYSTSRPKTQTIHMSGSDMNGQYTVQTNSANEMAHGIATGLSWFSIIILTGLGLVVLLPIVLLIMILRKGRTDDPEEDMDLRQAINNLHGLSERLIKRVDNLETILTDDSKDAKK